MTVAYATADGTATAGSHYQAVAGTLSFPPSVTSQTVNVPVIGNTLLDGDKYFLVNLSSPTNASVAFEQGTGTILDDDNPP